MLRRLVFFVAAMSAVVSAALGAAGAAGASVFVCSGSFVGLTVEGNLVVPSGAVCSIDLGSTVTGDVRVEAGGSFVSGQSEIQGNVFGEAGSFGIGVNGGVVDGNVLIRDSLVLSIQYGAHVLGNVEADRTGDVSLIKNPTIDGNVLVKQAPSTNPVFAQVSLFSLTVGGNVILMDNEPTVGLDSDQFARNLICSGNDSVTTGPNPVVVAGQKIGQCAGV